MKHRFKALAIVFIAILPILGLTGCSEFPPKLAPEYKGVDPKAAKLIKEYKDLAKIQGIAFDKDVTVGFKEINNGNVIGLCTYGWGWREIDIDSDWWYRSSEISRLALILHEADHCYCGRKHDYGNGIMYPETKIQKIREDIEWSFTRGPRAGRYEDGCPLSFMFPVILDDYCTTTHYSDYIIELFERCEPY